MPKNRRNFETEASKRPRIPNPRDGELLGVVVEIFGGEHMTVKGANGILYMGLIRGKIKKRMWCRAGDLVVIVPWDFETKSAERKPKAHIVWRYTKTQETWLSNHNYISQEFLQELQNI